MRSGCSMTIQKSENRGLIRGPSTSTAKPNIHGKKLLLCIWWDFKGVLYFELFKPGETITAERYKRQLQYLNNEIERKRPYTGKGPRPVILLHDNARLHTAKTTCDALDSLGWEILPHPAYSPDLALSDFYLFRSLQHHLVDSYFKTFEVVEKCITILSIQNRHSFTARGFVICPRGGRNV